jgi:multidrug efflux system outer membrane protein
MNEAAREDLLATEEAYKGVYISLISEVAGTYFYLRDLDQRLEISKQTLKSRQEYFEIINQRFINGIAPEWDLRQAEVQVNIAASAVPAFERAVAQTENVMAILLGRNPGNIPRGKSITDQTINPQIPCGLPSELLERRPDIMAAQHQLAAQNARIGVAQAQRFPSLSLTGLLGVSSTELASVLTADAAVMGASAALLGPVFEFQRNKRRVDVEKAKTDEALKVYELTVISAFADVDNSLVAVKTYKEELFARENQAKAALQVAGFSRSRYDAGVTNYLEVLDADRTNFDAQLKSSETKQFLLNSQLNLYKSLGGGWENISK